MTVDEKIVNTVEEATSFKCYHLTYTGADSVYFVFNYFTRPEVFSNQAQFERYRIQIHLFAPVTFNSSDLKKALKNALETNGFTYPTETDASDTQTQHVVFETVLIRGRV